MFFVFSFSCLFFALACLPAYLLSCFHSLFFIFLCLSFCLSVFLYLFMSFFLACPFLLGPVFFFSSSFLDEHLKEMWWNVENTRRKRYLATFDLSTALVASWPAPRSAHGSDCVAMVPPAKLNLQRCTAARKLRCWAREWRRKLFDRTHQ